MTTISLTQCAYLTLGLWILVVLMGLVFVVRYHELVFPSVSIDF